MVVSVPRNASANDGRQNSRAIAHLGSIERSSLASTPLKDSSTDRATAAFIRRTLCAHRIHALGDKGRNTPKPVEELLPPLTSSNEIDLELYAFIAIIIKDFVSVWYAKITPDHAFTDEVVQVIAHCTRQLEQRLRHLDLEVLLMDEIPRLVDDHILAYRRALEATQQYPQSVNLRQVYHAIQPHPALSPVSDVSDLSVETQEENEATWRQLLVRGVLALLLPTEDLENPCLRSLVAEIFSELVLGNAICGRACEPWMLWEAIIRIVETLRPREGTSARSAEDGARDGPNRLQQFGLLSSRKDVLEPSKSHRSPGSLRLSVSEAFWTLVQYTFLAFTAIRAIFAMFVSSSSHPPRTSSRNAETAKDVTGASPHREGLAYPNSQPTEKRPIISMGVWRCVSHLIELEQRMPWLAGSLSLLHWGSVYGFGKVCDTNSTLDRFLSAQLHARLLDTTALPKLLRAIRTTLLPNNTLAPPRAIPTPAQALELKQRAAAAVIDVLSERVCSIYFASGERADWTAAVESWLEVLGDAYLNKHLVVRIVELLVVRLMPELAEQGVEELLQERLEGL